MALSDGKKKKEDGRIFINYRRADSKDFAGRLDDTLTRYFGEHRVFRDIEDIPKGQAFVDVIKSTLDSSDAMIVLIGQKWLTETDENGTRRVDVEGDHVIMEIAHTLERGTPIFPVLIDDTPMPRPEELPESIRQLAERNAIHVSYERWEHDVTRLAQVIALDISGSLAERQLALANRCISLALFLAVLFTLGAVTHALTAGSRDLFEQVKSEELPSHVFEGLGKAKAQESTGHHGALYLHFGASSVTFIVIVFSVTLLSFFARLVDPTRRNYVYAAIVTGGLGTLFFFLLILFTASEYEAIINVFGSTVIAFAIVALLSLSGLKTR